VAFYGTSLRPNTEIEELGGPTRQSGVNDFNGNKAWYRAEGAVGGREEKIRKALVARSRQGFGTHVCRSSVTAKSVEIKRARKRVSQQKMFLGTSSSRLGRNDHGEVTGNLYRR